jgi:uncharacterized membrane protein YfcA
MLLSAVLGIFIGAILGLTGAGGGIMAVPALVFGMQWSMQKAAPVALIAVAMSAGLGAIEGLRKGLVRYKAALVMTVSGLPLTYLGQKLAHELPQTTLIAGFAVVMLVVAFRLYFQSHGTREQVDRSGVARINPSSGKFIWSLSTVVLLAFIGATTGLMTGLLGVGGGFVIVPMLKRFTEVSMQGIVATSLMVIALVGSGGVLTALARGVEFPAQVALWFTLASMIGMVLGRSLIHKIAPNAIQKTFASVLAVVSIGLLVAAARG